MRKTSLLSFVFVAALSVLHAQQAPAPSPQPPITFKSEVNYVEIDARVTDAQGNFVRDLTNFAVVDTCFR